nr:hypothetical protein [Tanacetum cinerariifolium]
MSLLKEALNSCAALTRRVEHLEHNKVAQALKIPKLIKRVKKLERANKGRMIADLDRDEGILLMDDEGAKKKAEDAQEDEPEVQEVVEVVTTAKLITEVVVAVCESVSAASVTIAAVPAATITVAPVRNVAGFILDYFKGMSYDDIRPIFEAKFNLNMEFHLKSKEQLEEEENRALKSINETPAQKAAKRRKLNEEVEELKQHLEIVPDKDDDVYIEATPLARKVPVMDYEIVHFNNKPHYKIVRADGTHQPYMDKLNSKRIKGLSMAKQGLKAGSCWNLRLRVEEQSEMSLELLSAAKQKLMLLDSAAERRLMLPSQVKTVNVKCCC